jgi:hypothetical protein
MEPKNKGQRARKGLTFTGPRNLLAWLESSHGAEIRQTIEDRWLDNLAAKLFDGSEESKQLQADVIERHGKETRCLIVAQPMENGSVYIECFGPRELKVHIITLPMAPLTAEWQNRMEQLTEVELPRAYKPLYYPSGKRRCDVIEVLDVREWAEKENRKMADATFSKALDGVKA